LSETDKHQAENVSKKLMQKDAQKTTTAETI
jgi:hypothetical protein